jgi:hypothetical protein
MTYESRPVGHIRQAAQFTEVYGFCGLGHGELRGRALRAQRCRQRRWSSYAPVVDPAAAAVAAGTGAHVLCRLALRATTRRSSAEKAAIDPRPCVTQKNWGEKVVLRCRAARWRCSISSRR